MNPRINYEMTEEDLQNLLNSCKPTPVMKIGSGTGSSPQENANRAWAALGEKMGFDSMTVKPISGKGMKFFTAVPSENEAQRKERERREIDAKRAERKKILKREIAERESELKNL